MVMVPFFEEVRMMVDAGEASSNIMVRMVYERRLAAAASTVSRAANAVSDIAFPVAEATGSPLLRNEMISKSLWSDGTHFAWHNVRSW